MEEDTGWSTVTNKKRSPAKAKRSEIQEKSNDMSMVDAIQTPKISENILNPSVPNTSDTRKPTIILRLETIIPADTPKTKINNLPMINDVIEEIMASDSSIEILSFNGNDMMTKFSSWELKDLNNYTMQYQESSGAVYNCYTTLIMIVWNPGNTMNTLLRNQKLMSILSESKSYLREHKLENGSVGTIGHIYLIDPQTINMYDVEMAYNNKIKELLKNNNDKRLSDINVMENKLLIELSPKHFQLTYKESDSSGAEITNKLAISTIEVKCKRRTSRAMCTALSELELDVPSYGFFVQSGVISQKKSDYISVVSAHQNLCSGTTKTYLYGISQELMFAEIDGYQPIDGRICCLYDLLGEITFNNEKVYKSIVNLSPNNMDMWSLISSRDMKDSAEDSIQELLREFMKSNTYIQTRGHDHSVMEHLKSKKPCMNMDRLKGIISNILPTLTSVKITPRASSTRRFVPPPVPTVSFNKNVSWSEVARNKSGRETDRDGSLEGSDNGMSRATFQSEFTVLKEHTNKVEQTVLDLKKGFQEYVTAMESKFLEKDEEFTKIQEQLSTALNRNNDLEQQLANALLGFHEASNNMNKTSDLYHKSFQAAAKKQELDDEREKRRDERDRINEKIRNEEMKQFFYQMNELSRMNNRGTKRSTPENITEDQGNTYCIQGTSIDDSNKENAAMDTSPYQNNNSILSPMDYTPAAASIFRNNDHDSNEERYSNNNASTTGQIRSSVKSLLNGFKEGIKEVLSHTETSSTPVRNNTNTDVRNPEDEESDIDEEAEPIEIDHDDFAEHFPNGLNASTVDINMNDDSVNCDPSDPPDLYGKRL